MFCFECIYCTFCTKNAIEYYCTKYNSLGSEFVPSSHTGLKINSLSEYFFNNFISTSKNIGSNNILEKKAQEQFDYKKGCI
jgi:hypothetical protein